ncbi:MAG TPA: pyrimidine dimer DNA glycosylase/endonuclease V [Treponemataceae bacterium]|nr:pyrimidine dimer DNA glycosylase/endonuclease V [Treponemataceae bacterium]
MRLWSLHPSLLDTYGLATLWMDSLKAQRLLKEVPFRTDIPALLRFTRYTYAQEVFSWYLEGIWNEAKRRELTFCYNRTCIDIPVNKKLGKQKKGDEIKPPKSMKIAVTVGQLWFEYRKLLNELEHRDEVMFNILLYFDDMNGLPPVHPIFKDVQGEIENWDTDWYKNQ